MRLTFILSFFVDCVHISSHLYSPPRGQPAFLANGQSAAVDVSMTKLKRTNPSTSGNAAPTPLSTTACIFSCYLVTISRVVCSAQAQALSHRVAVRPSIMQIIEEFASPDEASAAAVSVSVSEAIGNETSSSSLPEAASLLADAVGNSIRNGDSVGSVGRQDVTSCGSGNTSLHLPPVATRAASSSVASKGIRGRRRSDSMDTAGVRALVASTKLALMVS